MPVIVFIALTLSVTNAAASDDAEKPDARLSQKITYTAEGKTVSSILADLSAQTGVVLYAGYNNKDWQVRDRKMNIFATNAPLGDLMTSVARVMKFKWSHSRKDGVYTYRLYMDRKTLVSAERNRLLEENLINQWEQDQRTFLLESLKTASTMTDEELEKLKTEDPCLYIYSKIGWPVLIPTLLAEVPMAKQAWMSGDELEIDVANLSPAAKQSVLQWLSISGDFLSKVDGPEYAYDSATDSVDGVKIFINGARKFVGQKGEPFFVDVTVCPQNGRGKLQTAFSDPNTEASRRSSVDYIDLLEGGKYAANMDQGSMNQGHLSAIQAQPTNIGEPVVEHPDDPELMTKITMHMGGEDFDDALSALADASGWAVVSDSFDRSYWGLSFSDQETAVKTVLDKIESQCHYNWEKHGKMLEFRDRDWFRKRAVQIPEAWLEPWRENFRKQGTLDLNDLSQIAALDEKQFWSNILPDETLGTRDLAQLIALDGSLLRLYGLLNSQQQQIIFTPLGLNLKSLGSRQWAEVEKLVGGNPALLKNPDAQIILTGTRSVNEKLLEYDFKVTSADSSSPMEWKFLTPTYIPPIARKIKSLPVTGSGKKALDLYAEAKECNLIDNSVWFRLGMALYDGKYYSEALDVFSRISASKKCKDVYLFISYVWQGQILDLLGRREEALERYTLASKIDIGDNNIRHDQYKMVLDKKWVEERLKTPFERK